MRKHTGLHDSLLACMGRGELVSVMASGLEEESLRLERYPLGCVESGSR